MTVDEVETSETPALDMLRKFERDPHAALLLYHVRSGLHREYEDGIDAVQISDALPEKVEVYFLMGYWLYSIFIKHTNVLLYVIGKCELVFGTYGPRIIVASMPWVWNGAP